MVVERIPSSPLTYRIMHDIEMKINIDGDGLILNPDQMT